MFVSPTLAAWQTSPAGHVPPQKGNVAPEQGGTSVVPVGVVVGVTAVEVVEGAMSEGVQRSRLLPIRTAKVPMRSVAATVPRLVGHFAL